MHVIQFDNLIMLIIIVFLSALVYRIYKIYATKEKIRSLANSEIEITPEQFLSLRRQSAGRKGNQHISTTMDFAGVYIIYNKSKNKYYVGQGKRVFKRVNDHFTGHGNGDVYADYKYGDKFTIKMISLAKSGCSSLNELERNAKMTNGANKTGHNRTRGNRG